MRLVVTCSLLFATVGALPAAPFDSLALAQDRQDPSLAEVLKRAAIYVANFQKQLSGIVAEETYEQRVKKQSGGLSIERRKLRSDLLLVRPVGSDRYVEFRDVFEVDGRAPTLIRTPGGVDLPARGRFWIEPATGAVTRSELILNDIQIRATVTVTYRSDADLGFLVPAEMQEEYVAIRDEIEGRATYGKFRKFQVNVDETIKPVKQ
jgi:hypothetical protein